MAQSFEAERALWELRRLQGENNTLKGQLQSVSTTMGPELSRLQNRCSELQSELTLHKSVVLGKLEQFIRTEATEGKMGAHGYVKVERLLNFMGRMAAQQSGGQNAGHPPAAAAANPFHLTRRTISRKRQRCEMDQDSSSSDDSDDCEENLRPPSSSARLPPQLKCQACRELSAAAKWSDAFRSAKRQRCGAEEWPASATNSEQFPQVVHS